LWKVLVVDEEKHGRIKEALKLRGLSLSDIARAQGVKQSTVSLVSTSWRRSHRLESAIADALDLAPEEIWPDRYISGRRSRPRQPALSV